MRATKITFGEMRSRRGGTRGIMVYCNGCGHSAAISAGKEIRIQEGK